MSIVDYDEPGAETLRLREVEEQRRSTLPPIQEVRDANTMKIITINARSHKQKRVQTAMGYRREVFGRVDIRPVAGILTLLDDDRIKGFMPSKVWCGDDNDFRVMFYVNSSLPKTVRPFQENTYLLSFIPNETDIVEYDINMRIFLDQVRVQAGMAYVVMFGEETYKEIIAKELDDEWR